MDPYHIRLAQIGLEVGAPYGFALAGGYAIQANGFVDRPSEDVDLFTIDRYLNQFPDVAQAIVDAYTADGLDVTVDHQTSHYVRLYVTDPRNRQTSKVDLVVGFRDAEPIHMDIGPVLHPDDLMGQKMDALFQRAEARDFIDIYSALASGRYSHDDLLYLADRTVRGFERSYFADALGQAAVIPASRFAEYGTHGRDLDNLRAVFADWRAALLG